MFLVENLYANSCKEPGLRGFYRDWAQAKKNPTQETLGGTQSITRRDQPLKRPESSDPLLPKQLHDRPLAGKSRWY